MSSSTATVKVSPARIYAEARRAADAAAAAVRPAPMIVGTPTNPLGNNIDLDRGPVYLSNEGVCGWSVVRIRPARGAFVSWARSGNTQHIGFLDDYAGGFCVSVLTTNITQSYERNAAAARAFAAVLNAHGIKASAETRLD